jgi:RNA polymerase sigma-70 factor (ECF subfamily)
MMPVEPSSSAVDVLVDNHRRLLAFVERRVGTREAAEEILQGAFVRAVERISELRDEEKALPWFYQLLRNAIAGHFRSLGAERKALEVLEPRTEEGAAQEELLQGVVCECLHDLLGNLKDDYADILRVVDLGERDVGSYSRRQGITANNARVRLHRARAALRRELEKTCRTCTEHGCLDCSCRPSRRS